MYQGYLSGIATEDSIFCIPRFSAALPQSRLLQNFKYLKDIIFGFKSDEFGKKVTTGNMRYS